jgi:transmembrane sensor
LNFEIDQLEKLLDDESFLRWIRGTASQSEIIEWENWGQSRASNKILVEVAKKLLSIPFKTDNPPDVNKELIRLRNAINQDNNN